MTKLRNVAFAVMVLAFGDISARAQSSAPAAPGPSPQISDDHSAFAEALVAGRLAQAKALLKLTPDQEKLWQPFEMTIREAVSTRLATARKFIEQRRSGGTENADPIQRLTLAADLAAQRADSLKKILAAAQPLYASLSDDQKRRILIARRLREFRFDLDRQMFGMHDEDVGHEQSPGHIGKNADEQSLMGRGQDYEEEGDRSPKMRYDWRGGGRDHGPDMWRHRTERRWDEHDDGDDDAE